MYTYVTARKNGALLSHKVQLVNKQCLFLKLNYYYSKIAFRTT